MKDLHEAERVLHAAITEHLNGRSSAMSMLAAGVSFSRKDDMILLLGAANGTIANLVSVIAAILDRPGERADVWSEFLVQMRAGDIRNGRPT